VCQVARQVLTEQRVRQEQAADHGQRDAHHPPRGLEYQDREQHADDHIAVGQLTGTLDQVGLKYPLVGSGGHAGHAQQPGHRLPRP